MKIALLVAVIAIVAVPALARPQEDVQVLESYNDNPGDGTFKWGFKTSDGTEQDQEGSLKSGPLADGGEGEFSVVSGSYRYVLDGQTYVVEYTADETGYHAKTRKE